MVILLLALVVSWASFCRMMREHAFAVCALGIVNGRRELRFGFGSCDPRTSVPWPCHVPSKIKVLLKSLPVLYDLY